MDRRDRGAWAVLAALVALIGLALALTSCRATGEAQPEELRARNALLAQATLAATVGELEYALAEREDGQAVLAAVLAVEGIVAQAIEEYRVHGTLQEPAALDGLLGAARAEAADYLAGRADLALAERRLWERRIATLDLLVRAIWGQA